MSMEISQIIILLIPTFLFLLFTILLNTYTKNWLHPATFYSLIWFILIILPLIFLPNEITSPLGIYWILCTSIAFSAGALLTSSSKKEQKNEKSKSPFSQFLTFGCSKCPHTLVHGLSSTLTSTKLKEKGEKIPNKILKQIRILIITFISLGIASSLIVLFYQGVSISSLLSLNSYREITKTLSLLRYYTSYVPPLISQILLFTVYLSPLLGGILFPIRKTKRDIILSLFSIIPAIIVFLLNSTRYPILASIALWFASYFSFNLYLNKKIKIISKKSIMALLIISIFFLLILSATLSIRIGRVTPSEYLDYQIQTERATVFGYLPAFSSWFKESYSSIKKPSIGAYTFSGIFDLLKIKKRISGLYNDYIMIGNDRTNIFTAHRGLIEDFTLIGSLIFLFLIGLITGYSYSKTKNKNLKFSPILITFYSFTLLSFIASMLNYNSIILAILAYSLIIFSISKKIQNSPK